MGEPHHPPEMAAWLSVLQSVALPELGGCLLTTTTLTDSFLWTCASHSLPYLARNLAGSCLHNLSSGMRQGGEA